MTTFPRLGVAISIAIAARGQTGSPSNTAATIQFEKSTYTVNKHESGSALISVTRKGASTGESSVSYSTKGVSARAGIDFSAASGKLVFGDGETRKTFTVTVFETTLSGSASVSMELSDPQNATLGSAARTLLTIQSTGPAPWLKPVTRRVIKHVSLVVTTLIVLVCISWLAVLQANGRSRKWINDFLRNYHAEPEFPDAKAIPPEYQTRLKNQLKEVGARLRHHVDVMAFFYAAYYSSIVGFSVAGALAAVMAILVSKNGWQSADEYVANLFFTTTLAAAFFGSSPAVFEQEKNITDNKVFAMKYLALKNEILTFAITNQGLKYDIQNPLPLNAQPSVQDQKPKMGIDITPAEFLHYVDLQLSRDNVAIGFDVKQVADYKGALEMK